MLLGRLANSGGRLGNGVALHCNQPLDYSNTMNGSNPRSDQEIVDQTEELARVLMSWAHGRTPSPGVLMRSTIDPRGQSCWAMACKIQDLLTATDVGNALAELEAQADADEDQGAWNLWACAQETGHEFWMASGPGAEMRERLNSAAAAGRDVWLIDPKGQKHLPALAAS